MKIWKCLLILIPSLVIAQVNTEKLRDEGKKGFSGSISLGYGMAMGNSEYLSTTPAIRIDYNTTHYISFISVAYTRKQSELKNDKEYLLAHNGFAHVRSARRINSFLSWELFGQWEFNEFIHLERRLLAGTGARTNLLSLFNVSSMNLIFGVGGMFENEEYYEERDKALWRSTSYLKFIWIFSEHGSFQTISYYQVAIEKPEDFRLISESGLKLKLASWLIFGTSVNLRFDNDPTLGVEKKYDLELNNNLTVEF